MFELIFTCPFPVLTQSQTIFSFSNNDHIIISQEYGAGCMLTGEVKKRLTEILTEMVERHRRARAAVTDEVFGG